MKHISKFLLITLLVLLLGETAVQSQTYSLPGDGKDFFIGFVNPSYNKVANSAVIAFYGAYALVSTYANNHVTLSYFDKVTGVEIPGARYSIPARTGIQIPLDTRAMLLNDTGDVPEFCSCHITAEGPINVEFFSSGACGGGSYLPVTTAGLGKKYVIASYQNNPGELGIECSYYQPSSIEVSEGFFEIIATVDGTNVTITPNSTTMGKHPGFSSGKGANHTEIPYTVSLRRGQCYFVKSASDDNTDDISNSIVVSNKPIAVIAGHENASLGGVSTRLLEGRDYMVEQMYPYEMWDTTGYVMIPLKDSGPDDPSIYDGTGDTYRVFTSETPGTQINFFDAGAGQPIVMGAGRLQSPPTERGGVLYPVDIESTNGVKFTTMMYDQRNFANTAPFPSPSMITIIPMSRWRTAFLWYVPANKFESLQGYYVNIIARSGDFDGPNGIQGSYNGGTLKQIKQVMGIDQTFKNIPNHPELTGIRFKIYPGSYYARGPREFMVYNYGFRGLDPNNDLGDFDCDDYFFSYGLPVGIKLGNGVPHIRVTVDTLCSYWKVCAHDSTFGLSNQGIKSVTLLFDPDSNFIKATPAKAFYNTRLDDDLDPDHTGEIIFSGDDSDVCFKVLVNKPIDSAYAPLFIVDDQFNAIVVDLHYHPPLVKLTPDTGRYFLTPLFKDTCSSYVFHNIGTTTDFKNYKVIIRNNKGDSTGFRIVADTIIHGGKSFLFSSDNLKLNNPNFKVTSTVPPLPVTIAPGDSLVITSCFNPKDTLLQLDTIELVNDCFTEPIDLAGNGATPIIVADDHDFGAVIVDSTKCAPVAVRNVGNAPLLLTTKWLLDNYGVNFTFPNAAALLPLTLKPGQKITLTFCYTPHAQQSDSTIQHWGTNLSGPYIHSIKDTSILKGLGVKAGFVWDRSKQLQTVICDDTNIVRVYIYNNSTDKVNGPQVHVGSILFSGPNASEFYILKTQNGLPPVRPFDLNPGDSIWVDVVFKPNLAQPANVKYLNRLADLIAHSADGAQKDVVINFTGIVRHAIPVITPSLQNFGSVQLNQPTSLNFLLQNLGDTTLTILSVGPITPPLIAVDSIPPGFTLPPYDTQGVLVRLTMVLTNYTDTTIILAILGATNCVDTLFDTLHIAATYINPLITGHIYPPTFLNCRNNLDSVLAQNIGTSPLTLEKIELIDQNPAGAPQFSFTDNGTQILLPGKVFDPKINKTEYYRISYNPTKIEGPVTDSIVSTWDSLDVKTGKVLKQFRKTNFLSGVGVLDRDTISPQITTPAVPPNWTTGSNISVNVNFSGFSKDTVSAANILSTIPDLSPSLVKASGMTFSVTYRRDLLNYLPSGLQRDPSLSLVGNPAITNDGNGNETVTYNLQSVGGITQKMAAVTMQFEVMVSKEYGSQIAVSNAYLWGANPSDTLCYVIHKVDTTVFAPNPSCGDSALRVFLGGNMPTKIIGITPNPSIEGKTPVVTYQVKVDNVPLTIELFNALGERIRKIEKDVPHAIGEYNLPLGVYNLPSGIYILRITSPTSVESGEFVVQK